MRITVPIYNIKKQQIEQVAPGIKDSLLKNKPSEYKEAVEITEEAVKKPVRKRAPRKKKTD